MVAYTVVCYAINCYALSLVLTIIRWRNVGFTYKMIQGIPKKINKIWKSCNITIAYKISNSYETYEQHLNLVHCKLWQTDSLQNNVKIAIKLIKCEQKAIREST